jgi:MerR family transcriptional regulator, thiopeptide resistance regulator
MGEAERAYSIGELGRIVGLSRTALLYYDAIGLLEPSARTRAGYRRYSESDRARLERIMALRALGLPLSEIAPLLALAERGGADEGLAEALLKRLFEANQAIADLRAQQRGILELLEAQLFLRKGPTGLRALGALGARLGVDERSYRRVHRSLEAASPEEHRRLLAALGFSAPEIEEFLSSLEKGV